MIESLSYLQQELGITILVLILQCYSNCVTDSLEHYAQGLVLRCAGGF